MPQAVPDALICAFLEGELNDAEAHELSAWVTASRENARYLMSLVVVERGMVQHSKKHSAGSILAELAEMEANAPVEELVDLTEELKARKLEAARAAAARKRQASRLHPAGGTTPYEFVLPKLAVLGAVAAALFIAAFVWMRPTPHTPQQSTPPRVEATPPEWDAPEPTVTRPAIHAALVDQVDAKWEGRHGGVPIGTSLYEEELTLESGTAELGFTNGATLIVEGPARLTIRDADRVDMAYGRAVSSVPQGASPFTIDLPDITLENPGAELGFEALTDGTRRIDVFEGTVHARSESIAGGTVRIAGGQSVQSRAGVFESVTSRPSNYVRDLARLHYRDLVLTDAPLSYWPMQDAPASTVTDLVRGGMPLFPRLNPIGQTAGPMGGTALVFNGQSILDLSEDGALTTARYNRPDAFTFEAWVRPDATAEPGYIVVVDTNSRDSSGWGVGAKPTPGEVHLTPFLEIGARHWDFTQAQLELGRWTHLVVTKAPDGTARLYLNGQSAGQVTGVPGPPGRPQFFHLAGRLTGERWRGGMAHGAYYPRALAPGEIEQHARFTAPPQPPSD